jgi:hypothetical protein
MDDATATVVLELAGGDAYSRESVVDAPFTLQIRMYEAHSVFESPNDDGVAIWRYLDLAKFVSLLQSGSLYFPRADLLGDPHECTVPEKTLAARRAHTAAPPREAWEHAVGLDPPRVLVPRAVFVSCWNVSEYENAALWSVYGKSIAIETTFGALRDSFASLDEPVHIGFVKYIDYDTDEFPPDNLLHAVVHKRRFFENERELRAVILGEPTFSDWHYLDASSSWLGDRRPAVTVPVDLSSLIARVWIAPDQKMLRDVVGGLLQRYDLPDVEVHPSGLDDVAWRF